MAEKTATALTIGQRLKRLRQERDWSQAQFAQRVGIHQKQISSYERALHVPSTEVLVRVAEVCNVSLDFLAFEERSDFRGAQIADLELLDKLQAIDRLSEEDKTTVKAVLDTFIKKSRFEALAVG